MKIKNKKYLIVFIITFSLFINRQSGPATVRDFSFSSGPIIIGLPRWDGRDFAVVPRFSISGPFTTLPTGWIPPKTFPLPRELDRDFPVDP